MKQGILGGQRSASARRWGIKGRKHRAEYEADDTALQEVECSRRVLTGSHLRMGSPTRDSELVGLVLPGSIEVNADNTRLSAMP